MRWLSNLFLGCKALFAKSRLEQELDEELSTYLEHSLADKLKNGMCPIEARQTALRELGGSRNAVKHQVWNSRWESSMDSILQDLRMGFRSLIKSPGFTVIALVSLSLGIGGNTAIFTLMDQMMLRNLPVHEPNQLVAFGTSVSGGIAGVIDLGAFGGYFPWDFAKQLEMQPGPFQATASYCSFSEKVSVRLPNLAVGSSPSILAPATLVSGNYFNVLGAEALTGRTLLPADDAVPDSGAVVVLSHRFWRQSLSSDPAIVGKTININGTPFEVVGVMPESFHGFKQELNATDLWTPISMQQVVLQHSSMLLPHSGLYFLHILGRLSPQAAANKAAFAATQNWVNQQVRLATLASEGSTVTAERRAEVSRINVPLVPAPNGVSLLRSKYGESLKILMAVVGLVLLIACANLANFLLARATARRQEIATRLALGSSRGRIVRQSIIEALLLSLLGGSVGLGLAFTATRALIPLASQSVGDSMISATPNLKVVLFTLGVSLMTALLFGLAPALIASRVGNRGALHISSRTTHAAGGKGLRLGPRMLVIAQVTISLVLLVGAGLFLRTLRNLQNQEYGFERTHLLMADIGEKLAGYQPYQLPALHQQLIDRLSAIPGVRSVALAETPPVSNSAWSSDIALEGYTPGPKEDMNSLLNRVSGQYFQTAGISITAGRPISTADTASNVKVAVVNETVAKKFFPRGDAIGRKLTISIKSVAGPWQIVGIARDTRSQNPWDTDPIRMTYIPLAQIDQYVPVEKAPNGAAAAPRQEGNQNCFANIILVRTTGDPAKVTADLRGVVASIDPNLPLLKITTIREQVSNLIGNNEMISMLTAAFSALALLLAAIGLYGVMSYSVVQRTPEIGVRLALGAQMESVRWMIMRESLLLLAIGVAIGLPLTMAGTRGIQSQLFGISPTDPLTFAIAIAVIAGMTLLATWIPATRASRVDPLIALRYE
jgi:predicted permease